MTTVIDGAKCNWPRRYTDGVGLRWHLVSASRRACALLDRYKYPAFYPLVMTMQPTPRRFLSHAQRAAGVQPMRPHLEPLFAGYPFVRFDQLDERWHDLFELAGVRGVPCNGGHPMAVPDALVAKWQAEHEAKGSIPGETKVSALFEIGEEVRVTDGPFACFNGVIEGLPDCAVSDLDESARVALAMSIFGRPTRVSLQFGQIAKLEP